MPYFYAFIAFYTLCLQPADYFHIPLFGNRQLRAVAQLHPIAKNTAYILLVYNKAAMGTHEEGRKELFNAADGLAGHDMAGAAADFAVYIGCFNIQDILGVDPVNLGVPAGDGEDTGRRGGESEGGHVHVY